MDSALAELRSAAGLLPADLLAFDFARIARHETGGTQRLAQLLVVFDQRTRDAVADGTGLAGDPAALDPHVDVEAADHLHELERLAHDHHAGLAAEELVERTAVDGDRALAGLHEDARGRRLAATGGESSVRGHDRP